MLGLKKLETKFNTSWARAQLASCLHDFAHDDTLYDEQIEIAEALADIDFPCNLQSYISFCNRVLCWIPGEDDKKVLPDGW